ncbi:hypothetical protein ACLOJK_027142 [Asimina triloba]
MLGFLINSSSGSVGFAWDVRESETWTTADRLFDDKWTKKTRRRWLGFCNRMAGGGQGKGGLSSARRAHDRKGFQGRRCTVIGDLVDVAFERTIHEIPPFEEETPSEPGSRAAFVPDDAAEVMPLVSGIPINSQDETPSWQRYEKWENYTLDPVSRIILGLFLSLDFQILASPFVLHLDQLPRVAFVSDDVSLACLKF